MGQIALHLEFKEDGGYGAAGPGDTLRLLHALKNTAVTRVLSVSGGKMLRGLIAQSVEVIDVSPTTSKQVAGPIQMLELSKLLKPYLEPDLEVYHTFIGKEAVPPFAGVKEQFDTHFVTRRRIDSASPKTSLMYHDHWQVPVLGVSVAQRVLAVSIRELPTQPDLNTPERFVPLVRTVAKRCGWRILWYGFKDNLPFNMTLDGDEEYLPYSDLTLYAQLQELRSRAEVAVGWNSGGLDIAAAAGLPVLRIGEYQKKWPPQPDSLLHWGKYYNSYLATATNVGLAPEKLGANDFSGKVVESSLVTFLESRDQLYAARHAILPPGCVLKSSCFNNNFGEFLLYWPSQVGRVSGA